MTTSSTPERSYTCTDPHDTSKPCPLCKGMGVIQYDVPFDDPRFGKLYRCPNHQVEQDEDRLQRLIRTSNLSALSDKTFETFHRRTGLDTAQEESLKFAVRTAYRYAQSPDGWLLLVGPYGTGKTHLAAAIGNYRLRQGEPVLFITSPDLLDHLRSAYSPNAEIGYDELFERIRNTPLLIVDDLGVENPSAWANEKLFQLLNHRYMHRLPTIITTNRQLDHLDGRLYSRLMDSSVMHQIQMNAPDYREADKARKDELLQNRAVYRDMTFDTFDLQSKLTVVERENLQRVFRAARSYAQKPEGWFALTGSEKDPTRRYGNGKTHLAAAVANQRIEQGDTVIIATVADLLDYLRRGYEAVAGVASFEERMSRLRDVELLVIDDLSTVHQSNWGQEKLFQILDYRYLRRLCTVVTFEGFDTLDQRVRSRLLDKTRSTVFRIEAISYAERINRP